MAIEYITTRDISNKEGEVKGKVKIMKLKEESDAMIELHCPNCGASAKWKEPWMEPFMAGEKSNQKFLIKCRQCDFTAKLLKLKKEAKKEMKK